jgi:hypothetical protein
VNGLPQHYRTQTFCIFDTDIFVQGPTWMTISVSRMKLSVYQGPKSSVSNLPHALAHVLAYFRSWSSISGHVHASFCLISPIQAMPPYLLMRRTLDIASIARELRRLITLASDCYRVRYVKRLHLTPHNLNSNLPLHRQCLDALPKLPSAPPGPHAHNAMSWWW